MAKFQQYKSLHDPDSVLDYGRNWGDAADGTRGWLHENETIVISTWEITSDQEAIPTLVPAAQGSGISVDKKMTSIFLEGGTSGVTYKLTNTIITYEDNVASNRKESMTGLLTCCNK